MNGHGHDTLISKYIPGPKLYPDITVCSDPPFNISGFQGRGYGESFEYAKGKMWPDTSMVGWAGNTTVEDVIDNAAILKSVNDCPVLTLFLEQMEKTSFIKPSFEMTRMMHPKGKCCKVIPPKEILNSTLAGLVLKVKKKDKRFDITNGYTIYLSNREEYDDYNFDFFKIDGETLSTSKDNLGYWQYKLKINEMEYLDNHKDYPCKYYTLQNDFNSCISQHYLQQNLAIMNCTPPWMTSRKDLWCPGLMKMNRELEKLQFHLAAIANGRADHGPCTPSCRTVR